MLPNGVRSVFGLERSGLSVAVFAGSMTPMFSNRIVNSRFGLTLDLEAATTSARPSRRVFKA